MKNCIYYCLFNDKQIYEQLELSLRSLKNIFSKENILIFTNLEIKNLEKYATIIQREFPLKLTKNFSLPIGKQLLNEYDNILYVDCDTLFYPQNSILNIFESIVDNKICFAPEFLKTSIIDEYWAGPLLTDDEKIIYKDIPGICTGVFACNKTAQQHLENIYNYIETIERSDFFNIYRPCAEQHAFTHYLIKHNIYSLVLKSFVSHGGCIDKLKAKSYFIHHFPNLYKNNKLTLMQNFYNNVINVKLNELPLINCISLEESKDRQESLLKQFKEYNVTNIDFLISKRYDDSFDKITGSYAHTLNKGTAGCCVSHIKNIKKWYENTTESYGFFCEDDLSLETVKYWPFEWKEFINNLPNNWSIVQLLTIRKDYENLNIRKRLWNDWGATAYILKREYAKQLIDYYYTNNTFKLELPPPNENIQPLIENMLFINENCYTVPLFIENTNFDSTFTTIEDKDVHEQDLQKSNHKIAAESVMKLWKNKQSSLKFNTVVSSAKIVDCFPFFNEKELLELRINLLKGVVDEFIIIDSNYTHSGLSKSYSCKKLLKDLKIEDTKIKVIEVDLSKEKCGIPTAYDLLYDAKAEYGSRERLQRDALCNALHEYSDDTVFIISDCDEIINPNNVNFIKDIVKNNQHAICKIPLVYLQGQADYRVYKRDTKEPYPWDRSMFFATKQQLLKHTPTHIRAEFNLSLPITYVTHNNSKLEDLGWHFSWMGDLERIKIKAKSYCHFGMTLDNYVYKELYGDKMLNYFDNYELKEGNYPVSGLEDGYVQKYPIENLPKEIFSLPKIWNFLLPNTEFLNFDETLKEYSLDINNPLKNFKAGLCYYQQGHTAPALSYFLRCAERTNDTLLAYEALIFGYFCYKEQKIRDETAKSLIMHAVCLMPERPEARFLLSLFYEQKEQWMDSYYHACLGLNAYKHIECNQTPLKYYKDFPGKIGLLFQKAISGYWWGKNDESKNILIDLYKNYFLDVKYKKLVTDNLKRLGIENV